MNDVLGFILIILLISNTLFKFHEFRGLIIPQRMNPLEISLSEMIFLFIIIFYAGNLTHYFFGLLVMVMFALMVLAQGITEYGFISMYRFKKKILWGEIQKVDVILTNKVKVIVSGGFMQQSFYFKKNDGNRILALLKKELPLESSLNILEK